MDRLSRRRALVTTDPDVLGEHLFIHGTRIPVHDVAASVVTGLPVDRILTAYPTLDAEKIELACDLRGGQSGTGPPRSNDELPRGPSSSPIAGFRVAGRPDEVSGR